MRSHPLTHAELIATLGQNGWCYHASDCFWRAGIDPLSEPAVSKEGLEGICELWPHLAGYALDLMLAGMEWAISVKEEGYKTTVVLQPIPVLVSEDPPKFARPIKIK